MYWIIFIGFFIISLIIQGVLNSRFNKYSKEYLASGLTGRDVAEKMLHENGIYDVKVTCIAGRLTDHYNPTNKTLNLSNEVYNGSSVASAAVAAHECGHAVQHAEAYSWLKLRTAMVPAVMYGGNFSTWLIIIGLLLYGLSETFSGIGFGIAVVGVVLFSLTTLFAFVTLPVEFNASHRALVWLESSNIVSGIQHEQAKDALKWAARTYVVAALASLANLLYYINILRR